MKKDIHPKYFNQITATCACGAKFVVGSTKETIKTEICSSCHPFFTGQQRLLDSAGRVDKFRAAQAKAKKKQEDKVKKTKGETEEPETTEVAKEETPAAPKKAKKAKKSK